MRKTAIRLLGGVAVLGPMIGVVFTLVRFRDGTGAYASASFSYRAP
jgi:hypothetical protein